MYVRSLEKVTDLWGGGVEVGCVLGVYMGVCGCNKQYVLYTMI